MTDVFLGEKGEIGEICCQLHLLYPSPHEIKIIMFHWPIKPLCFKRKTEKFDCVWYHLCINAQHSSNPCEQMELCRSVTWFCKTAESSMPHLKFCLVCWLEKPLMTTTNKYKNLLWSVGKAKASPEWEKKIGSFAVKTLKFDSLTEHFLLHA